MKRKLTFREWSKTLRAKRLAVIITFLIVPIFLLVLFTYYPFAKMIEFSFYNMKYIGERSFVGLANYREVFSRTEIFGALKLTLYYIGGSVVQLSLALFFATIFCFKVKGEGVFKAVMFFPYLICGIAIGFIFKFFYTRGFVLDTVLSWIGFNPESLPYWLKDTRINNISLVATSCWRYLGQNMVLFLGAMMSVDKTLYEAGEIDGANNWQKFRYIMLPSIKSVVVLNIILSVSGSLSAFEPPYVITGGNFGTGTYFVIMNRIAHESQKVGLASAMAIVLMGIIIVVTILQKVIMAKAFPDEKPIKQKKVRAAKRGGISA